MKRFFENRKLYKQFKNEIDKDALYREAVEWTKAYFRKRGVPNWTSEYQNTFGAHVLRYCNSYTHSYAKRKIQEYRANN